MIGQKEITFHLEQTNIAYFSANFQIHWTTTIDRSAWTSNMYSPRQKQINFPAQPVFLLPVALTILADFLPAAELPMQFECFEYFSSVNASILPHIHTRHSHQLFSSQSSATAAPCSVYARPMETSNACINHMCAASKRVSKAHTHTHTQPKIANWLPGACMQADRWVGQWCQCISNRDCLHAFVYVDEPPYCCQPSNICMHNECCGHLCAMRKKTQRNQPIHIFIPCTCVCGELQMSRCFILFSIRYLVFGGAC